MDYDTDKVDEMVLALLCLTMFPEAGGTSAWKGHSWETLDRLHARGYISDPKSKAKSVWMSEEALNGRESCSSETSRGRAESVTTPAGITPEDRGHRRVDGRNT